MVESAASSAKAITAFRFEGLTPSVTGTIVEANHTVTLTVPYNTAVTGLVSTFSLSAGAAAKVGGTAQTSASTANDFTNPVTYTVTAADGTTQAYTVTANTSLTIGVAYGGGIVAYILQAGDPGYDANVQHGLIAATADQSTGSAWSTITNALAGTSVDYGTGAANTTKITSQNGNAASAAKICAEYTNADTGTGVYSDWYLPSKDELNQLYANRAAVGGFGANSYWSSSESDAFTAWDQSFANGNQYDDFKSNPSSGFVLCGLFNHSSLQPFLQGVQGGFAPCIFRVHYGTVL